MKTSLRFLIATAIMLLHGAALAEDPHHPPVAAATPAASPAPAGDMAAQCAAMMPVMQQMMQMMNMMQGGMTQGMSPGAMQNMPGGMSEASKAYMDAMSMMNAPMMQGAQASDPDVAFVKSMIPHHQGAIAMAKAVLQYGKDDKVKQWANQIIKAQEGEIAEMQAWLKDHAQ